MILIKSAQIVNGSGKPPFKGDILIKGKQISAIGNFPNRAADTVIDGLGLTITPGFIDVNTDSDRYLSLFTNPLQKDFLLQGVTTIIGGQCGFSLAPLLHGSLKSFQEWASTNRVNINWITIAELKKTLRKLKLGVNFATLVGHSTIRRDLIGDEIRDLTVPELEAFKNALLEALEDGALGLSTGLGYTHSRNIPRSEIKNILQVVKNKGGVYATHLRNEQEHIIASVQETVEMAEETETSTLISHFKPLIGFENQFKEAIDIIEKSLGKSNVYFDINPFDTSVFPVHTLLPLWAQQELKTMFETINDSMYQPQILKELSKSDISFKRLIIVEAQNNPDIVGRTLKEFSDSREKNVYYGLLELIKITEAKALLAYKNINSELLTSILFHKKSLIGSDSASLPGSSSMLKLERATNTFPQFLKIATSKNISIEETIKKITSIPAKMLGIQKRGLLVEGWSADLAMIKDNQIINTIVNGELAVSNGELTNKRAGIPL